MTLKSTVLRPISIVWMAFTVVAIGLAFYLDFANLQSLLLGRRTPDIEILPFTKEKGELVVHHSGVSEVFPSKEDIENRRVTFPLNLAVHNLERQALRDARIEVSYPKGLQLKPEGAPKIDPENRVLIYEHQLRPLEPVDSFTPLDTIDTIYVSADFLRFFDVKVSPDGAPYYVEAMSAVLLPEYEQSIELGIKFFAEGRPPKTGKIILTFQTVLDTFADVEGSKVLIMMQQTSLKILQQSPDPSDPDQSGLRISGYARTAIIRRSAIAKLAIAGACISSLQWIAALRA